MRSVRSDLAVFVAGAVMWALCFTPTLSAQDFNRSFVGNRPVDGTIDVDNGYMRNGVHYHSAFDTGQQRQGYPFSGRGNIITGNNKAITWEGPDNSSVYVQVDYDASKIFAVGRSGVQSVPCIMAVGGFHVSFQTTHLAGTRP